MSAAMTEYLSNLSPAARTKLARDSRKALRLAWPNRRDERGVRDLRALIVVESNLTMLRNLQVVERYR